MTKRLAHDLGSVAFCVLTLLAMFFSCATARAMPDTTYPTEVTAKVTSPEGAQMVETHRPQALQDSRSLTPFRSQMAEEISGPPSAFSSVALIIILILIALMVFNPQAKGIVSSVDALLARVFKGGEDLFKTFFNWTVSWLRAPTVDDNSETDGSSPNPHRSLKGILCLCVGGAAATADFYVLSKSLALVWPWTGSAQLLAFTLILLTALVGFAIHSLKGRIVRGLLIAIAFSLIAGQGLLSFLRTVEIERIREIERLHSALVIQRTGTGQGQLVFGRGRPKSASEEGTNSQPVKKQLEEEPGAITGKALIAGMIAALIAFGEMVGFYLGFYLAGAAITWVLAAPFLSLCVLGWAAFYVVRHVVEVLGLLLSGLVDAMAVAGKMVGHLARRLRPELLIQTYYELRSRMLSHRSELRALQAELETKHQIETLRAAKELSEVETEITHSSNLNAACRKAVEDWGASVLEGLEKTHAQISETISTEIIASSQGQAREALKSAAQRLVSSSTSLFEKIGTAINSAAPYMFSSHRQTDSDNGNQKRPEERI